MSGKFVVFVQGSSHYTNAYDREEPLPASNDSWILKLKPSVSFESLSSNFISNLFQMMSEWPLETKQDAFTRALYTCISQTGPSPNMFFPSLGIFSSEIAMHSIFQESPHSPPEQP